MAEDGRRIVAKLGYAKRRNIDFLQVREKNGMQSLRTCNRALHAELCGRCSIILPVLYGSYVSYPSKEVTPRGILLLGATKDTVIERTK